MVHVDDQVTRRQRGQFGHEGIGILLALLAPHQAVAEDVLLGDDFEHVVGKAGFQRQHQRGGASLNRQAERFLPGIGETCFLSRRFGEDRDEARAATGGIGGEDRLAALLAYGLEMLCSRFVGIVAPRTFGGEIARVAKAEVQHFGTFGLCERIGLVCWLRGDQIGEFIGLQIQRIACQRAIRSCFLARGFAPVLEVIRDVAETLVGSTCHRTVEHHHVVRGQVIEQGDQPVLEQRQPVFHPGKPPPVAHCLI